MAKEPPTDEPCGRASPGNGRSNTAAVALTHANDNAADGSPSSPANTGQAPPAPPATEAGAPPRSPIVLLATPDPVEDELPPIEELSHPPVDR